MKNSNKILLENLKTLKNNLFEDNMSGFVGQTIENLMLLEREEYLANHSADKGNGFYHRVFKSLFKGNKMMIKIARTRQGEFKPDALEILKFEQEHINKVCLLLYQIGVSSRDVSKVIKQMFEGAEVSHTTVSNLAADFNKLRNQWLKTKLEERYLVVYADALYVTVKRGNSYSKEAVFVLLGVKPDGTRQLLALEVNPTESSATWGLIFENLKRRGVKEVKLIVADGLPGLEEEVHKHFKGADFQKCIVHKKRNILNRVRPKDKPEIAVDLNKVFDNFDHKASVFEGLRKLEVFIDKWKNRYPFVSRQFPIAQREYYFSYVKYPSDLRRMIYTTNFIESANKVVRKATKNKLSFENTERLLDYVFMVLKDLEDRKWSYPIYQFKNNFSLE